MTNTLGRNRAPTQERVRELLRYDEATGNLYWRKASRLRRTDRPAGSVSSRGYIRIGIDRCYLPAHWVVWLYVYGCLPATQMDHINGVRADNRLTNLREASHAQNQQNKRAWGKSGLLGAAPCVTDGITYYRSQLTVDGKRVWSGNFKTAEEAHAAYIQQKRVHHQFFDSRVDKTGDFAS